MQRFFLLLLLVSSLFLAPLIFSVDVVNGQTQVNSLEIQGFAWTKTTLNALVVTPSNASWWNPNYLNCTLRAIGQWNEAIEGFASNYSDFAYLSNVKIDWAVSEVEVSGYDMYVNWTDSSLSNLTDEVGLSSLHTSAQNAIISCSVVLAVRTNHGDTLNEVDAQNIALHELGHSFGLGHCNYSGDVMYATYGLEGAPEYASTLDAYGVATLFAWELNASAFYPIDGWLRQSSVTLPANLAYAYLPVSPQNAAPQTLGNNPIVEQIVIFFEILLHPEILAIWVSILVFFVLLALVVRRSNRKRVV